MPIGSRSYYDSVNAAKKKDAEAKAASAQNQSPALKAAVEKVPDSAAAAHSPMDSVVSQVLELAGRTMTILSRAEEMAKRAEQILIAVEEAAERAQAGALRAELAASRSELNTLTSPLQYQSPFEEDAVEEADPMALLAEQLRSGIEQMDMATSADESGGGVTPLNESVLDHSRQNSVNIRLPLEASSEGAKSQGNSSKPDVVLEAVLGGSTRLDRSSLGRGTKSPTQGDALARSLVNDHMDMEVPRVSPYIIHSSSDDLPVLQERDQKSA